MLSVPLIVSAFVFAEVITKNELCKGVKISFDNTAMSFVTSENIIQILKEKGIEKQKTKVRDINISQLEKDIEENKWVKNIDIFVSSNNELNIKVEQKIPIIRIQPNNTLEDPYYLDSYGNIINYNTQYIPNLPVATVSDLGFGSKDIALKSDLVLLSNFIQNDTFWNVAISQIEVDENKEINLIPAFGNQKIRLGDVSQIEYKMDKLLQFYKQGLQTIDWNKYDEIDLRFDRQIVCRNNRGERLSEDPYDKTTHNIVKIPTNITELDNTKSIGSINGTKPIITPKKENIIAKKVIVSDKSDTKKAIITSTVKKENITTLKNENSQNNKKNNSLLKEKNKLKVEKDIKVTSQKIVADNTSKKVKEDAKSKKELKVTEIEKSKFFN